MAHDANAQDLWQMGAVTLADGIRHRKFSAAEVMASVLGRVEQTNPALNAVVVSLADEATEQAAAVDEAIVAGADVGPLAGVPVTIKENVDMAGMANPNGVVAFEHLMATEDAPLVRNLRNAGAIPIGRTNTPEFSMRATTDNPLRGRTVNPWDPDASPGGSSGGAGAACAAGMGPLHHGNDIGGSLRFPAFANGVMTVKPTSGRVPAFNPSAAAERGPLAAAMSVQGLIARHAADLRLGTRAMAAPDPRDPHCAPVPWEGVDLGANIAVAVTKETGGYEIHPGISAMIDQAADQLRDAGYTVTEVDPPPVRDCAKEWFRAGTTEMKVTMDAAIREHGSETINSIFGWYYELSEILDRDSYIAALANRTRLLREWDLFLDRHPLVLTPFLMRPLYDWDYDTRGLTEVTDLFDAAIYSTGINFLGLPAGVISLDMVEGRPAAVQLVGRRYREDVICDALEAIEQRSGLLTDRLWEAGA